MSFFQSRCHSAASNFFRIDNKFFLKMFDFELLLRDSRHVFSSSQDPIKESKENKNEIHDPHLVVVGWKTRGLKDANDASLSLFL